MAKLTTEVINRISAVPEYRLKLALSLGIGEQIVMRHLKENKECGNLTKINAIYCICYLLNMTMDEILDRSEENQSWM